jgi:isoquinoline 1-oxidoreductase beta subunit
MELSRRSLLVAGIAGGGLAVAWALRERDHGAPFAPGKDEAGFGAWIRIGKDGTVTVAVPQLEMGQGVTTVLPQVVAHELGASWRQVAVEPAPLFPAYANGLLAARWADLWIPAFPDLAATPGSALARRFAETGSFLATADGTSLAAYEPRLRAAAASARALLCMAAAARWNVDWQACDTADNHVIHGDKRLPFGPLAAAAASFDPPSTPPLRATPPQERPSVAKAGMAPPHPRIDLPAKADGSFLFAADVRLPGMVFAAIRHGPIGDSTLSGFDEAAASGIPGLVGVVKSKRWLAAAATDWWTAERALTAMKPRFLSKGRADSGKIETAIDTALRKGEAQRLHEAGDPAGQFATRASFAMRYDVAPALHATLETASAVARLANGRLELWIASQSPGHARQAAARALGLPLRDVVLYPMPAGGSFDRRLEHDHAIEAALIAREIGRPVSLTWSRWQEAIAGPPRAPAAALMAARTTPSGEITGWKVRIAAPAWHYEFGRRLFGGLTAQAAMAEAGGRPDRVAVAGAVPPYAIPNVAVDHAPARTGLPSGRMRGQAHALTCFFTESFIDELAHRAGREPLSYRIAMLGHDLRLAQCLQTCATLAQWDGGSDASGQGLACHLMADAGGSAGRIAVIATARRDEGGVRVDRIAAVADIGRIVNVDIARQQIEGGLVFGMGLALGAATGYGQGLPESGRLAALGLPLLADCPEIIVDFIDSTAEPFDPGELGVVAVAPAIANALFSAIGLRFRRLPLLGDDL